MRMQLRQNTTFYKASFDGAIFSYRVKKVWKPVFAVLGLNTHVDTPLNVILSYEVSGKRFFSLAIISINKYRFGQKKPEPMWLAPIFFLNHGGGILSLLKLEAERNVREAIDGKNLGLDHIDKTEFRELEFARLSEGAEDCRDLMIRITDHEVGYDT